MLDLGTAEVQEKRRRAILELLGIDVILGRAPLPPGLSPGAQQQVELMRQEMKNGGKP